VTPTPVYMPVPVDIARQICTAYDKHIVIICAWDHIHQKLHTTTYGASATDKMNAARGGETCARALGMDLGKSEFLEDFRTVDAAKNAQLRDLMLRHLPALKEMAAMIIDPPDSLFAIMVRDLEAALK